METTIKITKTEAVKTRWKEEDVDDVQWSQSFASLSHIKKMITNCMAAIDDPRRHKHCQTLKAARTLDFAWMLCLSAGVHDTPMWVGWSANLSQYRIAELPMQKICYLPHINESPTSTAVVQETMKIAKQIAEEFCQEYISITYDLAIAKITFAIQGEDPSYNNLFIQLRSFHILLSFFKGIGKLIADSRGPFFN